MLIPGTETILICWGMPSYSKMEKSQLQLDGTWRYILLYFVHFMPSWHVFSAEFHFPSYLTRVSLYRRERSLHDVLKQANTLVQNLDGRGGNWWRSGLQNLERTITTGKKIAANFLIIDFCAAKHFSCSSWGRLTQLCPWSMSWDYLVLWAVRVLT